jgi:DNA mismatch endonuclease (patch repair protein)
MVFDRHNNRFSIHSKDIKPELLVRHYLESREFRYRVNSPRLPGHSDTVLRKYRTCIFVNHTLYRIWLEDHGPHYVRPDEESGSMDVAVESGPEPNHPRT